nr:ABC transporter ATP-binding protein [Clostridium sp. MSJ-8]
MFDSFNSKYSGGGKVEIIKIKDFNFSYPNSDIKALKDINLTINKGELILLCGLSGSGKSTLLKNIKLSLAPHGDVSGSIMYKGKDIHNLSVREEVTSIGMVTQGFSNQIVTDRVYHEIAFIMENLGWDSDIIRIKVSEIASYFGLEDIIESSIDTLSGGQKQLINLASVMVVNPEVLILDEPTAQLDPIARDEFIERIKKVNDELGMTIIIAEHNLENIMAYADKVVIMEKGQIIYNDIPHNIGNILCKDTNNIFESMPTPVRLYKSIGIGDECPISLKEGRRYIDSIDINNHINTYVNNIKQKNDIIIELKDVCYKYTKNANDIVRDLNLKIYNNEIFTILGGNGAGKSTTLNLLCKIYKPYMGKIKYKMKKEDKVVLLPQDPETIFSKDTVLEELKETCIGNVEDIVQMLDVEELLDKNPYDLSGGEKQKVAIGKVLGLKPKVLLLDEITKGLDNHYKNKIGEILKALKKEGITIVMVTHDIEFAAKYSDKCAMLFNKTIVSVKNPFDFFVENNFYTTAVCKMTRGKVKAVTIEDVVKKI